MFSDSPTNPSNNSSLTVIRYCECMKVLTSTATPSSETLELCNPPTESNLASLFSMNPRRGFAPWNRETCACAAIQPNSSNPRMTAPPKSFRVREFMSPPSLRGQGSRAGPGHRTAAVGSATWSPYDRRSPIQLAGRGRFHLAVRPDEGEENQTTFPRGGNRRGRRDQRRGWARQVLSFCESDGGTAAGAAGPALTRRASSRALADVTDESTATGASIVQMHDSSAASQRWILLPTD